MDPTRTGRFLSEILHDDQLTVSCEVFIMLETYNKTGAVNKLKVPNCSVSEDLGRLLETPRFSDVTLCVEGKEFQVHQNILSARSPVFSAMFGHEMLESRERRVEISDLSADVVADLLRYVYSGVAPNLDHMAPELLAGADKYELNRLKVGAMVRQTLDG
jgi:speckle-type POZ protein